MKQRDKLHNQFFEANVFRKRAIIAVIACFSLVIIILIKLFFLQLSSHEYYSTLSENNRIQIQAIRPNRGLIYDRTGLIVAENVPNYRLEITPERVSDLAKTLNQLSEYLTISAADIEHFQRRLTRSRSFESVPLRFDLNSTDVARFSVVKHQFPGVNIATSSRRRYPFGPLAAHAIGYVGRITDADLDKNNKANYSATVTIGKTGIERLHEKKLHGTVGYKHVEVNVQGRVLRTLETTPPTAGNNLFLTINMKLQRAVENALGDFSGSIVVMAPKTGEILAMVSKPAFDLNLFTLGISQKDYQQLINNTEVPLFNRALSGLYPPGSTIKPLIALAGLDSGLQTPKGQIFCPGYYTLSNDDRRYRDWKKSGHGLVNLDKAITQSCDVLFYDLALRLGIDRISPILKSFGLGEITGVDKTAEATGTLPSRQWKRQTHNKPWYPGETLITGIGQGYMTMTPIQLASMTATIANRGKRLRPRLLHAIQDSSNNLLQLIEPELQEDILLNPAHFAFIVDSMEHVTHKYFGTARRAFANVDYQVAGKTGTSQVFGIAQGAKYDSKTLQKKLHDHALFIGFAPIDKPEVAIAVIAEHGGSGGSIAAPIARKVLDAYFSGKSLD